MKLQFIHLLALISVASAWLPHERNFFNDRNPKATHLPAGRGRSVKRYASGYNKIRGVNLGSLFIIEPWMATSEWKSMGCEGANSEFDCVMKLGQDNANTAFKKHWETYITEDDLDTMKGYGLNTIRVPVGYWIIEDLVFKDSEHFPQGAIQYLDRLAGWAAAKNIFVILDLHGAPGAQEPNQPFTGQYASSSGFFVSWQYERAYKFLQVITNRIHTNDAYRTTGIIEVLNEPERSGHASLMDDYYTTAYSKIREIEASLNVPAEKQLTIQFMDASWGAGNPRDVLGDKSGIAYDDHRYLKWAPISQTKDSYMKTSCSDKFAQDVIVGEWSLAVDSGKEWDPDFDPTKEENKVWYKQWWATQISSYESGLGWVFWSWNAQLGSDWRWGYKAAVEADIIPSNINDAAGLVRCGGEN